VAGGDDSEASAANSAGRGLEARLNLDVGVLGEGRGVSKLTPVMSHADREGIGDLRMASAES
jgi:hypothetical protein